MSWIVFYENSLCLLWVVLLLLFLLMPVAALTNILYLIVNLTLIKWFVQCNNQKKEEGKREREKDTYKCAYIQTHKHIYFQMYTLSGVYAINIHHFQRSNSKMQLLLDIVAAVAIVPEMKNDGKNRNRSRTYFTTTAM